MAVDPEFFKKALGGWPSGVTIVTSQHGDVRHGMTASAFCSVSVEPPQILLCANKESNTQTVIEEAGAFSISILAAGQEELSGLFADKKREDIRFDGLDCAQGATGCPRIPNALAWLDCSVAQAVEAGSHVIYVGRVVGGDARDGDPLIYCRGRYVEVA